MLRWITSAYHGDFSWRNIFVPTGPDRVCQYLHVGQLKPRVTGEGHNSQAGSMWAPLGSFVLRGKKRTPESLRDWGKTTAIGP